MNAKELRIGNLVVGESDNKKRPTDVDLAVLEFAHLFDPIPLTEDKLYLLGANESHNGLPEFIFNRPFQGMDHLEFIENDKGFSVIISNRFSGQESFRVNLMEVKYIHEVQNLCHLLYKEELELKK